MGATKMKTRSVVLAIMIVGLAAFVALGADDAAGTLQRAQELFTAGQYTQAESAAKAAITATTDTAILSGAAEVVILCKLAQGDFDGAKQAAEGLKGQITDAAAKTYLDAQIADIAAKKAAYDKAIADLEAALKAHPDDELGASAAYKMGATQLFWRKVALAKESFQRVIDGFAFSDRALLARLALGGIHETANQPVLAETLYEQAITRSPNSPYAAQAVARLKGVLLQQRDAEGAANRMMDIFQAYPKTEVAAMAEYCQGEILLFQGRVDEAKAKFDQVAREQHQTIAGGAASIRSAAAAISDARTLSDDGQFEAAIAKLREVLDLVPGSAYACQAHLFMGHNYLWLRNPVSAEPEYAKVLEEFPKSPEAAEARYYTAYCHTQTNPAKAVEELAAVLKSDPDEPRLVRAQVMLAGCYLVQKAYDDALKIVDTVLQDSREAFVAWHDDVEMLRAQIHLMQGNKAQATAELNAIIAKYPDTSSAKFARELLERTAAP